MKIKLLAAFASAVLFAACTPKEEGDTGTDPKNKSATSQPSKKKDGNDHGHEHKDGEDHSHDDPKDKKK